MRSPGQMAPSLPFRVPRESPHLGAACLLSPLTRLKYRCWTPLLKWEGLLSWLFYNTRRLWGDVCSGAQHSKLGHGKLESSVLTSRKSKQIRYSSSFTFQLAFKWFVYTHPPPSWVAELGVREEHAYLGNLWKCSGSQPWYHIQSPEKLLKI